MSGIDKTTKTGKVVNVTEAARLYVEERWTLAQVGKRFDVSHSTARGLLAEAGVTIRVPGGGTTAYRLRDGATDWQNVVLPRAVEILNGYDTPVTLRQLYYRLVSEQLIPNEEKAYRMFSHVGGVAARRAHERAARLHPHHRG